MDATTPVSTAASHEASDLARTPLSVLDLSFVVSGGTGPEALRGTIELARHDVGLPPGFSGTLAIGGRIGLWEEFLLEWLPEMQRCNPTISIRAESGLEPDIMQGLIEGRLDI